MPTLRKALLALTLLRFLTSLPSAAQRRYYLRVRLWPMQASLRLLLQGGSHAKVKNLRFAATQLLLP